MPVVFGKTCGVAANRPEGGGSRRVARRSGGGRARARTTFLLVVTIATTAACGGGDATPHPDASMSDAGPPPSDAHPGDGAPPLSWVDFAASGCATFDPAGPTCGGRAPLVVRFVPIAPAPLDAYLWSFGDGTSAATDPAPTHEYVLPGVYTVRLAAGGPGGTAQAKKTDYIAVAPAEVGDACAQPEQCAQGMTCACAPNDSCPEALAGGLCTVSCGATSACSAGVCADLDPAGGVDAGWAAPSCLAACTDDAGCRDGWRCRELRAGDGAGWVRACFPSALLLDEGASCAGGDGAPDPTRCASGACAPLGARGLCARDGCVADSDCPSYAECATFNDGASRCLARCSAERPCADDPWLACEAPGGLQPYDFTVVDGDSSAGYCAPRSCDPANPNCPGGGTCIDGHCAAAP